MTKKAQDLEKIENMTFRLAHLIRRFRTTHELSTAELAKKMGVSKPMVEVYENTKDPRGLSSALTSILRLSNALELSPSKLIAIMDGEINEEQLKDEYIDELARILKKSTPNTQAYLKLLTRNEDSVLEESITAAWNFVKKAKEPKDFQRRIQLLNQLNTLETNVLSSLVHLIFKLKEYKKS